MKATADQAIPLERIEARVQGDVSGQIAVGTHILQIGSVHGGIVNVAVPGKQPQPKARPVPIQLRPRPFSAILDRTEESGAAIRALKSLQSVELFGETGIGKTVLLRHLAHTIDSKYFPDGIIYREIRGDPPDDVLQMLWDDFFECDIPFKPTDSRLRSDLRTKNALIMLDAVELSRADVERVMNVAATCTFLLASPERHLWGDDTHAMHLAGLPAKDAKTLAERELGRSLTADEASAIEAITVALKGNPLRVLREVAMVRLNGRSLQSFAQDVQSPEKLEADVTTQLSDSHRRILSALAIFSGAPVQPSTLSELLQIEGAQTILEELEDRHLVRAVGGRYTLAGEVGLFMPKETTEERKRAVAYFAGWIDQQRNERTILETLPILMRSLSWGVQFGMALEVIRIAKSLEPILVLNGRWESWANALRLTAQSAINAGDKAALGWVRHQNGTKALCEGNLPEARESLEQALQIRKALCDKAGVAVTRHNLNLIVPPIVSPWKVWKVPASIAAVGCTFIAAMLFASKNPDVWHQSVNSIFRATPPLLPARPSIATAAAAPSLSAPSAATHHGASTHPARPSSLHIPPVIPQPAAPAVPEPPPISPSFPPAGSWASVGVPLTVIITPPSPHNGHPQPPTPRDGNGGGGGTNSRPGDDSDGEATNTHPRGNVTNTHPGKGDVGHKGAKYPVGDVATSDGTNAGKDKKGSGHGTASRNPEGSRNNSGEHQPGAHKTSKPGSALGGNLATAGRGQVAAGGTKGMGGDASRNPQPRFAIPPSNIRSLPRTPAYSSPYTSGRSLMPPMRTSRRH